MIVTDASQEMVSVVEQSVRSQLVDLDIRFEVLEKPDFPTSLKPQLDEARQLAWDNNGVAVFWCDYTLPSQVFSLSERDAPAASAWAKKRPGKWFSPAGKRSSS